MGEHHATERATAAPASRSASAGLPADYSSPAGRLLDRLEAVRPVGRGRWIARCPAHDDCSPSLSVRELADGRVLLHDFAGCDPGSVLAAVGLDLRDLFPNERQAGHGWSPAPRQERRIPARDLFAVLDMETLTVAAVAHRLAGGGALLDGDAELLATASRRIAAVRRHLGAA